MKGALFISILLVLSIFAGAMVIAKQGSNDDNDDDDSASLTSGDVAASAGFENEDIEADIDARADVPANWKSFPAEATFGNGWATSDKNGYFVRIAYVSKAFVNPVTDSTSRIIVTHGRLKIGNDNFKLVSRQTNVLTIETSAISFDVMKSDKKIGTFELRTTSDLEGNFKLQTGTLKLESKTYEVSLATDTKPVRKATVRDKTLQVARADKSLDDDASDSAEREAKEARKEAKRWWKFWKQEAREDRSGSNSGSG